MKRNDKTNIPLWINLLPVFFSAEISGREKRRDKSSEASW